MYAGVNACQRILTAAVMLNFSALTLLLQCSCAVYNREVSGFSGGVLSVLVFWACFCWVFFFLAFFLVFVACLTIPFAGRYLVFLLLNVRINVS
jgi:hypothetical protein